MIKEVFIRSLSARGSRNLPKEVTSPLDLAKYPSSQSVIQISTKKKAAMTLKRLPGAIRRTITTGTAATLTKERVFGRFQIPVFRRACTLSCFSVPFIISFTPSGEPVSG